KTSNTTAVPDSMRLFMGTNQQCFRFSVTNNCSSTGGAYFDNVSLALSNCSASGGAAVNVDIWQWIQDAFPANENPGLPGTAQFDTCAARACTGINIAQSTG